jgi:xanthine/CO dehydrogenase XdhC/CoxF family maturation factor
MGEPELPLNEPDPDPLATAERWRSTGRGVAIATVIATWGSSPRPVGSQLVLDEEGRFAGSVSGGCIEGAVIDQGIEAIRDRKPRVLDFGVSDERAWEVGLTCGGKVQVYVEPVED